MKIICVFTVCVISFGLTGSSPVQERKDPGCTRNAKEIADTCAEKLWFVGRKSRKYPENESELQKHCKQTTNLIKCVKDFTDLCANEAQRQLANVMLFTMRTNDKSYCTKSARKQEFMSMGVCGNQIREESAQCMDHFLLMLGKSNAYETRYKVPHACCAFHNMKTCIMRSAHESNQRLCTERAIENMEKYINTMSGNTLNLMCSDYDEDSDKCQSLPNLSKGVRYSKPLTIIEGFGKILD